MTYVFVSGPYTAPDPVLNVRAAIHAAALLLDAGLIPYVPHTTHLWHLVDPRPYEDYLTMDLAWVRKCDAVLRLPGHSPGADREVALAEELGLPVFHNVMACILALSAPVPR